MEESEQLEGTVAAVVFQNEENGYTVLRLKHKGEAVTAVGIMPGVGTGEQLVLTGLWTKHPSFGRQFKVEQVERHLPSEAESICKYLSSGAIKGIGPKLAEKIVDTFGEETFSVLEGQAERLAKLKGVTLKKARAIQKESLEKAGMRSLLEFLTSHSMPPELGLPLWKQYGTHTIDIIRADPYVLINAELGVRFREADRLASQVGVKQDDPRRIQAAEYYTMIHNLDSGHVFLPRKKLLSAAYKLLSTAEEPIDADLLTEGLDALEQQGQIVCETVAGEDAVYLAALHEEEVYIAHRLIEMSRRELLPPKDVDKLISSVEQEQGIAYAPQQRQAVELAAQRQVMLLTGGPGTGKTTSLRGILGLFEALGLDTALAAPTGRAAKRLSELCGVEAATIHRLLEAGYDRDSGQLAFTKCEDEPLEVDAVIVDETSMVDIPLLSALLHAMKNECRLVLVGDPDQLPSVGPGQLFDHLIRSGSIPTVRLTEIFRQAQESAIVMNAHAVDEGRMPDLRNQSKDFFFLRRSQGDRAVETIVELCKSRLPEKMGIPADQIQVLSPTRRYITGTTSLNQALQAALNPPAPDRNERKYGGFIFREGDRVMQVRNNYDVMWREETGQKGGMGVFNGDVGVITEMDSRGELVTVNFEGRLVQYTSEMLSELEPAYAMTVHKAQGSEYRAVILAALSGAPMLLTRGVFYTAMTRARELFIIVGDSAVIEKMVYNDRQTRRYSGLRARLSGGKETEHG